MSEMSFEKWLEVLGPMDSWNERIIMSLFAFTGLPRTYLDIGSGTGAMVNLARKLGVHAVGVDQLPRPDSWLKARDLRESLDLGETFQIVTCLEVAEHIPIEHDATFCDTVARHVAEGGLLVFSAAHPGQGGEEHVNLRPTPYWRRMMWDRGLPYNDELSWKISHVFACTRTPQYWLVDNVQAFVRGSL